MLKLLKNKHAILLVLILFTWFLYLFDTIKFAKSVKSIIINFNENQINFKKIKAFRISPTGNKEEFKRLDDNKVFYFNEYGFFKRILIIIPSDFIEDNINFNISIGNKKFIVNKDTIGDWQKEENNNCLKYYSPEYISLKRSIIPKINTIINWQGDFDLFILSLVKIILLFISIFICLYLTAYFIIPKRINEDHLDRSGLNDKSKNIFEKFYDKKDDAFILDESKDKKNRIALLSILDKLDVKAYKKLYLIVFFAVLIIAFILRMSLLQLPFCDNDIRGYLEPVINYHDTGVFTQYTEREVFYPAFVLFILNIFNDFSYISIIQHLIGIITGIMLLYCWHLIIINLSIYKEKRILFDLAGIFLVSLYLFMDSILVLEQLIRPESIYPLFLILQIIFFIKLYNSIKNNNKIYIYIFAVLFFVNNFCLYKLQPRWGINIIFNLVLFIILFFSIKNKNIKKILLYFLLPLFISFFILLLPEKLIKPQKNASRLYITLFAVHANIIDIELENDINDKNFQKYDKNILNNTRSYIHNAINHGKRRPYKIGFNPNDMIYGELYDYFTTAFTYKDYTKFCRYYFIKSIVKHPLMYAKKVIYELSQFYNFDSRLYNRITFWRYSKYYRVSYRAIFKNDSNYYPYLSYIDAIINYRNIAYDINKITFPLIDTVLFLLSISFLFTIIIFLLIILIRIILRKLNKNDFIFLLFIIIIFLYNFFINLTCASVHTLEVSRYIADQTILALLLQFLALIYICINVIHLKNIRSFFKK